MMDKQKLRWQISTTFDPIDNDLAVILTTGVAQENARQGSVWRAIKLIDPLLLFDLGMCGGL